MPESSDSTKCQGPGGQRVVIVEGSR